MGLIVVLAVVLELAIPAVRVASDGEQDTHDWPVQAARFEVPGWAGGTLQSKAIITFQAGDQVQAPFWPEYWRALAGCPRGSNAPCGVRLEHPGETCTWENFGLNPVGPASRAILAPAY